MNENRRDPYLQGADSFAGEADLCYSSNCVKISPR